MGCYGYICKGCGTAIRGDCFMGGEKCVLLHVRHGEVLGSVEGHYNEYGSVIEDKDTGCFNSEIEGVNSHSEIGKSLFRLDDSYLKVIEKRIYEGKPITYANYLRKQVAKDIKKVDYDVTKLNYYSTLVTFSKDEPCFEDSLRSMKRVYKELVNLRAKTDLDSKEKESKIMLLKYSISTDLDILIDFVTYMFLDLEDHPLTVGFYNLPPLFLCAYSGVVAYHSKCYKKAKKEGSFDLIPSKDDPNQSWGVIRKKYL